MTLLLRKLFLLKLLLLQLLILLLLLLLLLPFLLLFLLLLLLLLLLLQVLTFLDSHIECTPGWLEPLLDRIGRNSSTVVCPVIDIINTDTLEYVNNGYLAVGGFDWNLIFNWHEVGTLPLFSGHPYSALAPAPIAATDPSLVPAYPTGSSSFKHNLNQVGSTFHIYIFYIYYALHKCSCPCLYSCCQTPQHENIRRGHSWAPMYSPTMAGGLFAIDREFFTRLGTYDSGFEIWGGENLELSFKTWMCGGTLEIVPCSHVGHIFR